MDCFSRKTYEPYIEKEALNVVRWDKVDIGVIKAIFGDNRLRLTAKSLVRFFEKSCTKGCEQKKLGRYLYPAGNFDDMLLFLRCAIGVEECDASIRRINQSLERNNAYGEPPWVLWGRFLTDVLDVLRQWEVSNDKEIDRIIKNF